MSSLRTEIINRFGISPDELRARFDFYFDKFDVRAD